VSVNELEDVLGLAVTRFVDRHVRSLLTWDLLVFFHRNPDAVLDTEGLAARLGRHPEELQSEVDELCRDGVLQCAGGLVRYRPDPETREAIAGFVSACQERGRRLALIALVLHKINPRDE
jgi:DNA-binding Lrp family transcriptional regulator